jgi:hypothetical protein
MEDLKSVANFGTRIKRKPAQTLLSLCAERYFIMAKNLLIVESPAKAKTIEAILGKDFEVKSCFGHIRDLEKNDMGIDVNNNFTPKYIVPAEKERVVKELKALAKKAEEEAKFMQEETK